MFLPVDAIARNWALGANRAESERLYALALVERDDLSARAAEDILAAGAPIEYVFPARTIRIEEPPAVTITATQGGAFIEHRGSIFKYVTISGHSFFRPNQQSATGILGVRNPLARQDIDLRNGLPRGERSGHEQMVDFINLIRAYYAIKADPRRSYRYQMIWQDGREGEFYVVEPEQFERDRDRGSPVTTSWTLRLRTIERVDVRGRRRAKDARADRVAAQNRTNRFASYARTLSTAINLAANLVDVSVSTTLAAIDDVLSPARDLLDAITSLAAGVTRVFSIPRNSVATLARSVQRTNEAIERLILASDPYLSGQRTPASDLVAAYRDIGRVATRVHAETDIFQRPIADRYERAEESYQQADQALPDGARVTVPTGATLAVVQAGDTVYTLSSRTLGAADRWRELVMLNDLRAPYIADDGDGAAVLRPGDLVRVPSAAAAGTNQLAQSSALGARQYGRDLRITRGASVDTYDLAGAAGGDAALIEGADNVAQAVLLRFATGRNRLPLHPSYGLRSSAGDTTELRSLISYQLDVRASLTSDPRIRDVRAVRVTTTGNVASVSAEVLLEGTSSALQLGFERLV